MTFLNGQRVVSKHGGHHVVLGTYVDESTEEPMCTVKTSSRGLKEFKFEDLKIWNERYHGPWKGQSAHYAEGHKPASTVSSVVPDIGLHKNVPFETYLKWDAASNSRLGILKRSPAHLKHYLDTPSEDTDSLALGRATHMAILEPDRFSKLYVRGPEGDRRTKAVKEEWGVLQEKYGPEFVLKPGDFQLCVEMRESVWRRKSARELLENTGENEVSLVWDDISTGERCKARIDRLINRIIVDVKTTSDASLLSFEKSVYDFGYYRQAPFYKEGCSVLGIPIDLVVHIAVEKKPPFEVAVYQIDAQCMSMGMTENLTLLERYQVCRETGKWQGYPDRPIVIGLPAYAQKRIESEEIVGRALFGEKGNGHE